MEITFVGGRSGDLNSDVIASQADSSIVLASAVRAVDAALRLDRRVDAHRLEQTCLPDRGRTPASASDAYRTVRSTQPDHFLVDARPREVTGSDMSIRLSSEETISKCPRPGSVVGQSVEALNDMKQRKLNVSRSVRCRPSPP
ncbi:hypothetical protein [Nonomuraea rhodomycinica]|uniref:Uncharacterized protein n=1 Tax=Nonomuraea rhodomycinica TaxID=1712872 RepID=A0A7Y6II68_9ACTN|nr:hypothetical protein [Nonomuraea rhodomycinica]NUW38698.1 hypothetical protein [Nonomuraea rhodomycinica]